MSWSSLIPFSIGTTGSKKDCQESSSRLGNDPDRRRKTDWTNTNKAEVSRGVLRFVARWRERRPEWPVGQHSISVRDLFVYAENRMIKHSLRPKVSAIDRPLTESTFSERSSALPRELPASTRPAQSNAVADSELDRPEEGRDPTLPGNTVHGAPGHQIKEPRSEDEDDEGRSTTEQLTEAGAQEAEQDKVTQAARAAPKTDRS